MKTKSFRSEDFKKNWHLVDAENKVLGRLAVKIANIPLLKDFDSFL